MIDSIIISIIQKNLYITIVTKLSIKSLPLLFSPIKNSDFQNFFLNS